MSAAAREGRVSGGEVLRARVRVRRGSFALDVALEARPGGIVAVVGPNGAGKSTLLGALAGLLAVDDARITCGDRVLTDTTGGVHVGPERRSAVLLGQDALVFPHLSVRENVAFAPRAAGVRRAQARRSADEWLAAVGLEGLADRGPGQLSGGQRQRVALARALAARPAVLLLDEPFAQLDVRTAAELRDLVREQVRGSGAAAVLVTHDVVDALTLADHVLVLHDGAVVEEGTPIDVLTDPVHAFTAALAGLNLVAGTVVDEGESILAGDDGPRLPLAGVVTAVGGDAPVPGARAQLTFPPAAVSVVGAADQGWDAVVVDVEPGPAAVRVRTTGDVLVDLAPAEAAPLDLRLGAPLRLAVASSAARLRALPNA